MGIAREARATGRCAMGGFRRFRRRQQPDDRIEDLRERGEEVWDGLLSAVRQARRALGEQLGKRGPRLSEAIRRRGPELSDAVKRRSERLAERLGSVQLTRKEEPSMLDKLINRFTLGFGVGYVLGARAGRQRYEQIVAMWERFAGSPTVRQAAEQGKQLLDEGKERITDQLHARGRPERVSDVMTPMPTTVRASQTVAEAANNMRQIDVGSMIVVDDSGAVVGIVTDRDIAIRVVAQGLDPQTTIVGEISSEDPTTLSSADSVEQAVHLMRERAVRRLPVVEEGRPVGIVSIGDLAIDRDPRSALAEISREVPNR
jgi:CBS domain-containing protein